MSHTKGEWKVGYTNRGMGRGDYAVVLEHGTIIAEIKGVKEVFANARLMAAAPALLAACKQLIGALANCPGEFNYDPKIEDQTKQAIAQADTE